MYVKKFQKVATIGCRRVRENGLGKKFQKVATLDQAIVFPAIFTFRVIRERTRLVKPKFATTYTHTHTHLKITWHHHPHVKTSDIGRLGFKKSRNAKGICEPER